MPYIVPDSVREPLYAIVPYSNAWRWKSREKHTTRAIKHFMDAGAVVVLVEVAFNRRSFAFADSGLDGTPANCGVLGSDNRFRHKYIGLRSASELWHKENQINLAVSQLPYDWQQVCWLDSDVHFVRPNWVGECIHKLQHYSFLQMFSQARDLAPNYEMMPESYPHAGGVGFVHHHIGEGFPEPQEVVFSAKVTGTLNQVVQGGATALSLQLSTSPPPYPYAGIPRVWPGLAWAATRKAWDDVGGLIDFAIWGGGDWHMAHALIEKTEGMMRDDLHDGYKKRVMQWYHRCRTHIRQNVGCMEGAIFHSWHGRKTDRGYNAKHALLAEVGFDPDRHLKRDYQGLWQLHDDRSSAYPKLRDLMRAIAKERDEDSNDTRLDLWDQGH
jgi:hypothetical protein